ncbi:MAG: TolC family outer membrane protein [Bauldia sp.]
MSLSTRFGRSSGNRLLPRLAAIAALLCAATPASAEPLNAALASAYTNNPTLNAARATLRATDEGVPQALSNYRPTVSLTGQAAYNKSISGTPQTTQPCTTVATAAAATQPGCTYQVRNGLFVGTRALANGPINTTASETLPRSVSLSIVQPIFSGFRTVNGVKAAETAVLAGRETLRTSEQDTLLAAVTAYMNLVRDQAIVGLNRQNVAFLNEQVRAAQNRLNVGEGTRTDVAQAQATLANAESTLQAALATVSNDEATYNQVIGHPPKNLVAAAPLEKMIPATAEAAVTLGLTRHPSVLAAQYNIDTAEYNVKLLEGNLLPNANLTGTLTHADANNNPRNFSDTATITGRVTVPLYDAGATQAQIRAAKERLGQSRIQLDAARDNVRALAVSGYGSLASARASVAAAEAGVRASQLALEGVQEEQRVGQRTTLDVLNAQQTLVTARTTLVRVQRDRVVATYTLLSATGGLSAQTLGLAVKIYDPTEHYDAVHDKWFGITTPDGR